MKYLQNLKPFLTTLVSPILSIILCLSLSSCTREEFNNGLIGSLFLLMVGVVFLVMTVFYPLAFLANLVSYLTESKVSDPEVDEYESEEYVMRYFMIGLIPFILAFFFVTIGESYTKELSSLGTKLGVGSIYLFLHVGGSFLLKIRKK